ncbi:MAG: hypothetical protein QOH06_3374 [Acidobacteriota bacterium]|jgi:hypothetical protein|nr:hypothetical protein [Acidobacteriota bacterium]
MAIPFTFAPRTAIESAETGSEAKEPREGPNERRLKRVLRTDVQPSPLGFQGSVEGTLESVRTSTEEEVTLLLCRLRGTAYSLGGDVVGPIV